MIEIDRSIYIYIYIYIYVRERERERECVCVCVYQFLNNFVVVVVNDAVRLAWSMVVGTTLTLKV